MEVSAPEVVTVENVALCTTPSTTPCMISAKAPPRTEGIMVFSVQQQFFTENVHPGCEKKLIVERPQGSTHEHYFGLL